MIQCIYIITLILTFFDALTASALIASITMEFGNTNYYLVLPSILQFTLLIILAATRFPQNRLIAATTGLSWGAIVIYWTRLGHPSALACREWERPDVLIPVLIFIPILLYYLAMPTWKRRWRGHNETPKPLTREHVIYLAIVYALMPISIVIATSITFVRRHLVDYYQPSIMNYFAIAMGIAVCIITIRRYPQTFLGWTTLGILLAWLVVCLHASLY